MTNRAQNRREHEAGLAAYRRFRATQEADNQPRTYIAVNADTGEAAARPDRCRDAEAAEELAARIRDQR